MIFATSLPLPFKLSFLHFVMMKCGIGIIAVRVYNVTSECRFQVASMRFLAVFETCVHMQYSTVT